MFDQLQAKWASLSKNSKIAAGAGAGLGLLFLAFTVIGLFGGGESSSDYGGGGAGAGAWLAGGLVTVFIIGLVLIAFMLWLLPFYIAVKRNHPSKMAICIVNLVFGWTFIGWIVALIWALSNNGSQAQVVVVNQQPYPQMYAQQPYPQMYAQQPHPGLQAFPQPSPAIAASQPNYQVGDVVNGHRFTGVAWEPVA